jgi:hypothetical protein
MKLSCRNICVVVGAMTLALSVCSTAFSQVNHAAATGTVPALQSVSAQRLAEDGITLAAPSSAPGVSADDVQATALQHFPGSQVRERVLAVVRDDHVMPAINGLFWIVSIVPPGGIWSSNHQSEGTYDLLFIDAMSGKYFFGTKGGV